jgi:hypothetical protein
MATAICEKHKLRFDPETHSGCVLCRKEAGAVPAEAAPAAKSAGPAAGPAGEAAGGLGGPLGVAAAIWLVAALALYTAHQQLAAAYVFDESELEAGLALDEEQPIAAEPPSGTAAGQTDAVLREIRALQGDEPPLPAETGAPAGVPGPEQLAPPPTPVDDERPSTEPVEIELEGDEPPQP